MEIILHQLRLVVYPHYLLYMFLFLNMPGGAGFLSSAVAPAGRSFDEG